MPPPPPPFGPRYEAKRAKYMLKLRNQIIKNRGGVLEVVLGLEEVLEDRF